MAGRSFADLIDGARRGDDQAFVGIYRALHPQLLRYLRVVARGDADDIASETWARVVRGLAGFSGDETGFRSWVFTIARRQAIDWQRHEARRPSLPTAPGALTPALSPSLTDDAALEQLSTARALEWIRELPPDQAEVVMLRAVVGLDVARVAEIVGKRPGTVRVLAHRGLRALATRLDVASSVGPGDASPRSRAVTP